MKLEQGEAIAALAIGASCPVGVGVWSFVDLVRIGEGQLDELVVEAWALGAI